jgi:hypothetical protein
VLIERLGPLLCTEYMSRGNGSMVDPNLGYLKQQAVDACNWGLVDGKSQTIYPWDSWKEQCTAEPPLWFHDIFRRDGMPYRSEALDVDAHRPWCKVARTGGRPRQPVLPPR